VHTAAELSHMQTIHHLKLQRATVTRWLSHQNAVDALRMSFKAVNATLQQEGIKGDATAFGLSKRIENSSFNANLLFLSIVLAILGNLSRTFQLAQLNLLTVDHLITDTIAVLSSIKDDPVNTGYMVESEATMKSVDSIVPFDESSFIANVTTYLDAVITNLKNRFPQISILLVHFRLLVSCTSSMHST
jgi:hypothetical protein